MAKEKQTRRMIAMALAAAVAMGSMPVSAFAEDGTGTSAPVVAADDADTGGAGDAAEPEGAPAEGTVVDGPINVTIEIPSTPADDPETPEKENQNTETFGPEVGTQTGDLPDPDAETDPEYEYEEVTQQGSVTVETTENEITTEYGESDLDYVHSDTTPDGKNDVIKENASVAPDQFQPGYEPPVEEEGEQQPETPAEGDGEQQPETPAEGDQQQEDGYDFASDDEKYQFEYVGTGNTSQFRPAMVFTEPMTDQEKLDKWGDSAYINASYPELFINFLPDPSIVNRDADGKPVYDENGRVTDKEGNPILKAEHRVVGPDGKTYYLHRIDNMGEALFVEGWNQNGEWVEDLNAPAELDKDGNPVLKTVQLKDQNGNPILGTDGQPVYVEIGKVNKWGNTRVDGNLVSGAYGALVKDKDGNVLVNYAAVYATAQQFVLVDKTTGEVITTYCADVDTVTEMGFGYNIENLEDADYYDDAQAERIRAIAEKGYWGTKEGTGSLDAMKEMLKTAVDKDGNRLFTDEEIDNSLTDGVALTATQMAIWSCSNHMAGTEFINTHYVKGEIDGIATDKVSHGALSDVPLDKEDEATLMFRVYEYLKNLEPISYEGEETTADTIINAENFLDGDMEITVLEKAKDHVNNQDDDDSNDAYTTNLSFALVVQPSTENGDDLVVSVVDKDGKVVAKGRIAGDASADDDSFTDITDHGDGNYTFNNITMVEGEQEFNISLEGIQNLKEGVYLYTSEVKNEGTEDEVTSQTMVGMASGSHSVKVAQKLNFSFDVEDEKVVVHEKHSGSRKPPKDPEPFTEIPDEEPPLTEIPDEEPPLAETPDAEEEDGMVLGAEDIAEEEDGMVLGAEEEAPLIAATGDSNHMTAGFGGMLAALAGMFMLRRKKEN